MWLLGRGCFTVWWKGTGTAAPWLRNSTATPYGAAVQALPYGTFQPKWDMWGRFTEPLFSKVGHLIVEPKMVFIHIAVVNTGLYIACEFSYLVTFILII
jgi:hypothetical protein